MTLQIHDRLQDPPRLSYFFFYRGIEHHLHPIRTLEVRMGVGYVMVCIAGHRLDDSHFGN